MRFLIKRESQHRCLSCFWRERITILIIGWIRISHKFLEELCDYKIEEKKVFSIVTSNPGVGYHRGFASICLDEGSITVTSARVCVGCVGHRQLKDSAIKTNSEFLQYNF